MRWLVVIALGIAAVVALLFLAVHHPVHGTLGTPLVYDDFAFVVAATHEEPSLAGGELLPRGVFRVVELRVENRAQRVDYGMTQHRAVLFDAAGERYGIDEAATRAWIARLVGAPVPPVLHAGESATQELVYDVPPGVPLELGISWGNAAVDLADRALFGMRRIALP